MNVTVVVIYQQIHDVQTVISGALATIWPHYNDALRMHKMDETIFLNWGSLHAHGHKYVCCYFYIMHGLKNRYKYDRQRVNLKLILQAWVSDGIISPSD